MPVFVNGVEQQAASVLQSTTNTETRAAAAASGDVSYTGAGFVPTAIIVTAINEDDDDSFSVGFGDDAAAEDLILVRAMASTPVMGTVTRIVHIIDATNAHSQHAVLKILDADGCTFTWTKVSDGRLVHFNILYLR